MKEKEFNIRLGKTLREERKRIGYSIYDVAERIGVSKSTVSYWENGERTMSALYLKMYCDVLNIGLDDFVKRLI